jgi:hypothetical protein
VRRARSLGTDAQGQLFATCQHDALISNRTDALALVKVEHRARPVVELAIRDTQDQRWRMSPSATLAPTPPGQ